MSKRTGPRDVQRKRKLRRRARLRADRHVPLHALFGTYRHRRLLRRRFERRLPPLAEMYIGLATALRGLCAALRHLSDRIRTPES